jgi:hypothetical protein
MNLIITLASSFSLVMLVGLMLASVVFRFSKD